MTVDLAALAENALETSWTAMRSLAWLALAFAGLAFITKGRDAIAAARRAIVETRINLSLFVLDTLVVLPLVLLMTDGIGTMVTRFDLALVGLDRWQRIDPALTAIAAIFLGDFISYWRHRLEHTRLMWPAHAIHHSDTAMTWLTLARFHPINRFVTVGIDTAFLALIGFPEWALVINNLVRHFYGHFIHADLSWTYGKLAAVFVSPVMHRWHHVREGQGVGSNFATVFSIFDRAFGTRHVPGLCDAPLGIAADMGQGAMGQLLYPFREWARALRRARTPVRD
jgi:sterol desaturase/sphingolipid hydroxylase (fatty acid hydroxylase superfamily)